MHWTTTFDVMPSSGTLPHVLLINPWIHDFAAYDVWAKPMGLLILAGILRLHDIRVSYMDCLDRFHPKAPRTDPHARNGRGPYLKTRIHKPPGLEDIPRNFSRYGIKPEWFADDLKAMDPPDLIFITSLMTYWYPGVFETIRMVKTLFPETPVVLGGIYATLFHDHARQHSGADRVVAGSGTEKILDIVQEITGFKPQINFAPDDLDTYPLPAFDLQHRISYIPLLTSIGCPFSCAYCASPVLSPKHMRRDPKQVFDEILFWHKTYNVRDFAFYDDALLVHSKAHIIPLLEAVIASGIQVKFHTPNALHVREITKENARLMKAAGFHTLRLGLETSAFATRQQDLDEKVTRDEFVNAVAALKKAGFEKSQVGAYLLTGLPGDSTDSVQAGIKLTKQQGITPVLAHYTPIPKTALWERARTASRYDLESDPVFTNNAISPCQKEPFSWEKITALKKMISP